MGVIPERADFYAAVTTGLVALCAAVAGGVAGLLTDDPDSIARATGIGAGFGALIGLVLAGADAVAR